MLSSNEIHQALDALGCSIENGKPDPSYAYEHYLGENKYLYVKRKKDHDVKASPLVVSPDAKKLQHLIDSLDGVTADWSKPTKSTSYRRFPKFNGNESPYGYAFNVRDKAAIERLLDVLGAKINEEQSYELTEELNMIDDQKLEQPLNQIFYGPPGTGKTFHTIEASVKAATPSFKWSTRDELKAHYDALVESGRIRFVTFHQSYGYEEFVEGLSAKTEKGQISYYEKNGVFKQICLEAQSKQLIFVGDKFNSFEVTGISNELVTFRKKNGNALPISRKLVEEVYAHFKAGKFDVDAPKNTWLSGFSNEIETYFVTGYDGLYKEMLPKMRERDSKAAVEQNYVLVIDEINRGNISKIFGELITLLEPSKRSGNAESIELVLPYSGERFSVPNNLYIIGTMNTADRSLAMMDTALRRRFDFVEMMPIPALLGDVEVEGIKLGTLLQTMNQRIEILYDREHALGHAFFMPVKKLIDSGENEKAFVELQSVFKNKIIPLLEEYFYEDWEKIRLVLGDNQKVITSVEGTSALQFVRKHDIDYQRLFGSHYEKDDYGQPNSHYHLALPLDGVWTDPNAYKAIYAVLDTVQNADF